MSVDSKMTAIADAIRDVTGETEALTLDDMVTEIPKVYDEGYSEGYLEGSKDGVQELKFWEYYQTDSQQYLCSFYGQGWNDYTFRPVKDIGFNTSTFSHCGVSDLKQSLLDCGVGYNVYSLERTFQNADTKTVPDLSKAKNNPGTLNCYKTFYYSYVETVDGFPCTQYTVFNQTFHGARRLKSIRMKGTIGQNILFPHSPLDKDSIISIFNALSSSATGKTLQLRKSAVNAAFGINVDSESSYPEGSEYYELRHSKDNWTIAYV